QYYAAELHKVYAKHIAESSRLNITVQGNNTVQVPLNDIVYIRHQKNYSYFYLTDGKTLCQYISLSKIEESIPANTFVRINKSTLANMKHIVQTSVKDKTVTTSLADPQTGEAVTLNLSPVFADSAASLLINKGSIE
ncbi:MAG: LytTR family transcriptional regulator, partial [Bacteroidales bacterium]|nr:LytTR family transcriptional regulator [Bacteroidales bacterium]